MNQSQRIFITRTLGSLLLVFWVIRWLEAVTPSTLEAPPLFLVQMDLAYWAFKLLGLHRWMLASRVGAWIFDLGVLISLVMVIRFPLRRGWLVASSGLLFLYLLASNGASMHHLHMFTGAFLVLFPFWAKDLETCSLLWSALRSYTCLAYALAFVWKAVFLDSFFHWSQGEASFRSNLLEYLYYHPQGLGSAVYRWFFVHGSLLNLGWILIVGMEGLMVVGLFTRKWDRLLIWFPIAIHGLTYFFSDVYFIELLVLDLSLLRFSQWDRLRDWISIRRIGPAL